jgi:hypothetical protein
MLFLEREDTLRPIIETAFAYQDICLWTKSELAYLEPSEELALRHNREQGWGFDPEQESVLGPVGAHLSVRR